jgi:hypothetical protein
MDGDISDEGRPCAAKLMARFTTRVELDGNPSRQDYNNLHQAMKRAGFSRFITGGDGKNYRLPHAEYDCTSGGDIQQIRSVAHNAASSVWSSVQVLVTAGDAAWSGLAEATPAEMAAA